MMQRLANLQVACRLAGFSPAQYCPLDGHGTGIGLSVSYSINKKGQAIDPNLIVGFDMRTSFINKLPVV